jgi:competence protein ComGC
MKLLKRSSGFTLVELLVVGPIIMVVVLGIVTFLFNEYGNLTQQNGQLNLQVEAQNILFSLQDDIWYANSITSDINSNLSDSYAPQGGWKYNTSPQTLIISTPALTKNHRDPTRTAVYLNESTCTPPDGNGVNSALYDSVIYFVSGANLYKRILTAPANLAICGVPFNKQTCPPANASPSCPADKLMSDHLATFSITYYDTGNSVVTTPENAESIKVSIGLADKAFAQNISASSSLRLRKINQ